MHKSQNLPWQQFRRHELGKSLCRCRGENTFAASNMDAQKHPVAPSRTFPSQDRQKLSSKLTRDWLLVRLSLVRKVDVDLAAKQHSSLLEGINLLHQVTSLFSEFFALLECSKWWISEDFGRRRTDAHRSRKQLPGASGSLKVGRLQSPRHSGLFSFAGPVSPTAHRARSDCNTTEHDANIKKGCAGEFHYLFGNLFRST